jgi:hypothetical protein
MKRAGLGSLIRGSGQDTKTPPQAIFSPFQFSRSLRGGKGSVRREKGVSPKGKKGEKGVSPIKQ